MRKRRHASAAFFLAFFVENLARFLDKVEFFSYLTRQILPRSGKFCRVISSVRNASRGRFS
jgi:hypothetical protein